MHLRLSLLAACLVTVAHAQNNLPITPTGTAFLWNPPQPNPQVFFDMTVNTTVTLQGLTYSAVTPMGTTGSIEIWITNAGTTTHVGNETNAALWSMLTSGPSTFPATPTTPSACFTTPGVLQPGTYGVAVRYVNVGCLFYLGTGSNQMFSNAELTVSAGSTQFAAFTAAPLTPYVPFGTLYYGNGAVAQNCASATDYGAGCYATRGSFYQRFATAGATAAALNGRALTMTYSGIGYIVNQSTVAYIAPTAAATSLPTSNNLETVVVLPSPLLHPGGTSTQVWVSTNGYVSDAANQAPPGALSYLPNQFGLLTTPATMWALAWHDYNTAEAGSGLIKYEQVGNLFVITWDGVESFPDMVVNPSRLQIQFDLVTYDVHYVWVTMDASGNSPFHDQTVVGFSVGGPSPDLGPTTVATVTSLVLTAPELLPLTLAASAAPVLGTTVALNTSNEGNANVGINFLSLGPIAAPGIDLGVLGAPGCAALLDIGQGFGNLISNLGTPFPGMSWNLVLPLTPSLAGTVLATQSIWLDPAANVFGIKSSNAVRFVLGLFAI